MAYGKTTLGNGSAPSIGNLAAQREMMEHQQKMAMYQNRLAVLQLAIQATPHESADPKDRDSIIFKRFLDYEQIVLKGRDALTIKEDKKQESNDEPIQKKADSASKF